MGVKSFLIKKDISKTEFYLYLLVVVAIVVAVGYFAPPYLAKASAKTAAQPFTEFKPVLGMTGTVTKNEGSNLLGYHWVTFQQDGSHTMVTALSNKPILIGDHVYVVEAKASLTAGSFSQMIDLVLPGEPPRQ